MDKKLALSQDILELLKDSIREVYQNENDYFKIVNGQHRHERQIVFRIAHVLANKIEGEKILIGEKGKIFVDFEPNRCNGRIKEKLAKGKRIIPDLIIHVRDETGYLVAEFKYGYADATNDYEKLHALTRCGDNDEMANENCPNYKLGVFIRLKNSWAEYTLFKDGEIVSPENKRI